MLSAEVLWIICPPTGWALWSWGGTGFKPARRFILPLVLGLLLLAYGISWLRCLLTAISLIIAYSLGYGEGKSWIYRALVGMSYGASLLWIRFAWWPPILTAMCFVGLMWLSRRFQKITWKFCEGTNGLLHGVLAVWLATAA